MTRSEIRNRRVLSQSRSISSRFNSRIVIVAPPSPARDRKVPSGDHPGNRLSATVDRGCRAVITARHPRSGYGFFAPERTKTGMVSSVVVIAALVPPAYRLPVK
ncbi:hypothetical protein L3i22_032690 [Actinoplanes sp. L3-i22]|nr:hypothetical protein L3i22_032690 [Actinoplanes sp. L3-i22]